MMRRRCFEHLYHLAETTNFASIERYGGLLGTSRLLDQAGLYNAERDRLERRQRLTRTVLPTGVVIRDQVPMPESALARCLIDMKPAEWYALVNTMVFFWTDRERLLRQARACRPWPQLMIELNIERFLSRYGSSAFVTAFNVGNARRRPALRGRASFVPFSDWSDKGWAYEAGGLGVRERSRSHPPAELVIPNVVPDITDYIVSVRPLPEN